MCEEIKKKTSVSDSLDSLVRCFDELPKYGVVGDEWGPTIEPCDGGSFVSLHDVKLLTRRNASQITENPWCEVCQEKHCVISLDGTCAMIREYLKSFNE